jgi:hypothetical protein
MIQARQVLFRRKISHSRQPNRANVGQCSMTCTYGGPPSSAHQPCMHALDVLQGLERDFREPPHVTHLLHSGAGSSSG